MFDQNNISWKSCIFVNPKAVNMKPNLKIKFPIEKECWNWILSDGEMSPVEEVLNYQPFGMVPEESKMVGSSSALALGIPNFSTENSVKSEYPNSCQNSRSKYTSELVSNEVKEIDLIYHFETFRNQNPSWTPNSEAEQRRSELSPEFNSRQK